jgi:peptidoglycan hydrolase CwlO-like protein
MKMPLLITAAASLALLSGACSTASTGPDTGERISQRATKIGDYGSAWSGGQKNVKDGQQLVEKSGSRLSDAEKDLARSRERVAVAERQIAEAQANRTKGQQLVQDGTGQMQRAEADYAALRTGPSALRQEN